MSETIIGALIGAGGAILGILVSILSQFLYFHLIEKGKLQKEREFSFLKESFFKKQGKCFELQSLLDEILVKLKYPPEKGIRDYADTIKLKYTLLNTTLAYLPDLEDKIQSYLSSTDILQKTLILTELLKIEDMSITTRLHNENLRKTLESYGKEYEDNHIKIKNTISDYLYQEQTQLLSF